MCQEGDIDALLHECRTIQSRLQKASHRDMDNGQQACLFAKKMQDGNLKAAIRMITKEGKAGILPLNSKQQDNHSVKDYLLEKHPERHT